MLRLAGCGFAFTVPCRCNTFCTLYYCATSLDAAATTLLTALPPRYFVRWFSTFRATGVVLFTTLRTFTVRVGYLRLHRSCLRCLVRSGSSRLPIYRYISYYGSSRRIRPLCGLPLVRLAFTPAQTLRFTVSTF